MFSFCRILLKRAAGVEQQYRFYCRQRIEVTRKTCSACFIDLIGCLESRVYLYAETMFRLFLSKFVICNLFARQSTRIHNQSEPYRQSSCQRTEKMARGRGRMVFVCNRDGPAQKRQCRQPLGYRTRPQSETSEKLKDVWGNIGFGK